MLEGIAVSGEAQEILGAKGGPDRDNKSAAIFELVFKVRGNFRGGGGDNNGIERGEFRPAQIAVATFDPNLPIPESGQPFRGALGQFRDQFDTVDFMCEGGEDGGLVSGAGAYFQQPLAGFDTRGLGHEGDNIRLGNGDAIADGKRVVVISLVFQGRRDKQMPGHPTHGSQYLWVSNIPPHKILLDHKPPGLGILIFGAACTCNVYQAD